MPDAGTITLRISSSSAHGLAELDFRRGEYRRALRAFTEIVHEAKPPRFEGGDRSSRGSTSAECHARLGSYGPMAAEIETLRRERREHAFAPSPALGELFMSPRPGHDRRRPHRARPRVPAGRRERREARLPSSEARRLNKPLDLPRFESAAAGGRCFFGRRGSKRPVSPVLVGEGQEKCTPVRSRGKEDTWTFFSRFSSIFPGFLTDWSNRQRRGCVDQLDTDRALVRLPLGSARRLSAERRPDHDSSDIARGVRGVMYLKGVATC